MGPNKKNGKNGKNAKNGAKNGSNPGEPPGLNAEPRYRDGTLLCNAKNNTCGAFAMSGGLKCYNHGGATPRGPAAGRYAGKGRSAYVPTRITDKFLEAMEDPDLCEYRADVALYEARLRELGEGIDSRLLWTYVSEAFGALQAGIKADNQAQVGEALTQMHSLINRGSADALRWREIYDVLERQGRAKEREHKRMVALQQMISLEQFLVYIGMIVDVLANKISDRQLLREVTTGINQLWAGDHRAETPSSH